MVTELGIDIKYFKGKFESEHLFGVRVLIGNAAEDLDIKRRRGEGAQISNQAPAYYENKELHRLHDGTGYSQKSKEYRNEQNSLLLEGKVEGEILLNQIQTIICFHTGLDLLFNQILAFFKIY